MISAHENTPIFPPPCTKYHEPLNLTNSAGNPHELHDHQELQDHEGGNLILMNSGVHC